MARFIPIDKMKKLREAAKNGDEKAQKLLRSHLNDTDDYSEEFDLYFSEPKQPVPGVKEIESLPKKHEKNNVDIRLETFLQENGIKEGDSDYNSYVEEFYEEYGKEDSANVSDAAERKNNLIFDSLISDEIEAIEQYNNAIIKIMSCDGVKDSIAKGILTDLEEIKRDEIEHLDKLKRIKSDLLSKV